jgi:hypothetical protein
MGSYVFDLSPPEYTKHRLRARFISFLTTAAASLTARVGREVRVLQCKLRVDSIIHFVFSWKSNNFAAVARI